MMIDAFIRGFEKRAKAKGQRAKVKTASIVKPEIASRMDVDINQSKAEKAGF